MKGDINRDLFYKLKAEKKAKRKIKKTHKKKDSRKEEPSAEFFSTPLYGSSIVISRMHGDAENIQSLSRVFDQIRNWKEEEILLDFSKLAGQINSLCMLWLYSEIYRKIEKDKSIIKCIRPPNKNEEKVLQHVGFYSLIGVEERIPKSSITEENIEPWRVETGNMARGERFDGKKVADFLDKYVEKTDPISESIYPMIQEIINNSIEHAYKKDEKENPPIWVMFGRFSENKDRLIICVGDLGLTIPGTMRKWIDEENIVASVQWQRLARQYRNDTNLIKYAVKHRRLKGTRKATHNRGNGLYEVNKIINELGGEMVIYSRKGLYSNMTKQKGVLERGVKGTIIVLEIPLKKC